jgi:hypothetical protein
VNAPAYVNTNMLFSEPHAMSHSCMFHWIIGLLTPRHCFCHWHCCARFKMQCYGCCGTGAWKAPKTLNARISRFTKFSCAAKPLRRSKYFGNCLLTASINEYVRRIARKLSKTADKWSVDVCGLSRSVSGEGRLSVSPQGLCRRNKQNLVCFLSMGKVDGWHGAIFKIV